LVDERQEKHIEGAYYLDWTEDGKPRRMAVGTDATAANNSRNRKGSELEAMAQGLVVTNPIVDDSRLRLHNAKEDFLEDIQFSRQSKTWLGYCLKVQVLA
jgi:integrase/recombinase XerD